MQANVMSKCAKDELETEHFDNVSKSFKPGASDFYRPDRRIPNAYKNKLDQLTAVAGPER